MSEANGNRVVRLVAAAVFFVMIGAGYAVSTQVEAMDDSRIAIPTVPAASEGGYFPAQHANQAQGYEDHIQAF